MSKAIDLAKKQLAWAQHEIKEKFMPLEREGIRRVSKETGIPLGELLKIKADWWDIRVMTLWDVLILAGALGIKSDKLFPPKPGLTPKGAIRKETGLL
jgi:hypothetical protein